MRLSKGKGAAFIVMLLLVLDQALKIWIKTHFQLHESVEITPWFYIYFTENPGMAFGIEVIGKLFLTVFRIVAVAFISYYLVAIPAAYLLGFKAGLGAVGIWTGFPIGLTIAGIFYFIRFRTRIRQ